MAAVMHHATPHAWLRHVDWSTPWQQPWREPGIQVQEAVIGGLPLWDALNATAGAPVRFVSHTALPSAVSYEDFIFQTGSCPVRTGLHDFFNGLCWLRFPRTKQRLNQLQQKQISQLGVGAVRGPVRDALTLFDENAALLYAPDCLWDALSQRDWSALFGPLRAQWAHAQLLLFGHALLEKLQRPRKSITAHVYRIGCSTADVAALDRWLADDLDAAKLAEKPFAPLPVLGVPGWWPGNQKPDFHQDPTVFRPRKPVLTQAK